MWMPAPIPQEVLATGAVPRREGRFVIYSRTVAAPPIRLMVCDDNSRLRLLLVQMINGQSDVDLVGEASSAEELLKLLDGEVVDVVLLDVNLPGLSGLDTIAELREAGYENAIVVMSADRRNEDAARRLGASAFFYKGTTDIPALFGVIREAASSSTT